MGYYLWDGETWSAHQRVVSGQTRTPNGGGVRCRDEPKEQGNSADAWARLLVTQSGREGPERCGWMGRPKFGIWPIVAHVHVNEILWRV